MKNVILHGERVTLRPFTMEDVDAPYLRWVNDKEVTRFLEVGLHPVSLDQLTEFAKQAIEDRNVMLFAIVEKTSGRHIGNLKLDNIQSIHQFAVLGILIGEQDCWNKGYGSEAVSL